MDYILNLNPGVDVLHRRAGLTENCNTDGIRREDRRIVGSREAAGLVQRGEAEYCEHCVEDPD